MIEYFNNRSKNIDSSIDNLLKEEKLYNAIISLSNKEFADEIVDIVSAEKHTYSLSKQNERMYDVITLLRYGLCYDDIKQLLMGYNEQIAIKLIQGGF